jgi:hypothetical protein
VGVANTTSVNGVFKVDDENGVIGSMGNATKSGVNDPIAWKLIVSNPPRPEGNQWADNTPIGSNLFIRAITKNVTTDHRSNFNFGQLDSIFKDTDRCHLLTPQRLNWLLHDEALDSFEPRSLLSVFREWKLCGIMGSPPDVDHGLGSNAIRVTNERVVNTYPSVDGHSTNYWGNHAAGDCNSFLHWKLIEAEIQAETMYNVEADGTGTKYLGNQVRDVAGLRSLIKSQNPGMTEAQLEAEVNKRKVVKRVPRFVPRLSNTPVLTVKDREYTVKLDDGTSLTKMGYIYKLGRCKVNPKFDERVSKEPILDQCCDMRRDSLFPKLDVLVNVKEHLVN